MLTGGFQYEMAVVSLLFLYFFVRKKSYSLLLLSFIFVLPLIADISGVKPFETFGEVFLLVSLLVSLPFLYLDKRMKKYKTINSFFDRYDFLVIFVFIFFMFLGRIK